MAYISSNANRWYVGKESAYGQVPAIAPGNRIPAVKLTAQQQRAKSQRQDKTGSRTWQGLPAGVRLQTSYDMTTYMRDWPDPTTMPSHGPLFEAALGAPGVLWPGNIVAAGTTASNIAFTTPHGLVPGQAITSGGEIRFVAAIVDASTVVLNAPFSAAPALGAAIGPTATYNLAEQLPSFSIFDYWDPVTAVQRVLCGAAVDGFHRKAERRLPSVRLQGTGAGSARQLLLCDRAGWTHGLSRRACAGWFQLLAGAG